MQPSYLGDAGIALGMTSRQRGGPESRGFGSQHRAPKPGRSRRGKGLTPTLHGYPMAKVMEDHSATCTKTTKYRRAAFYGWAEELRL